MQKIGLLRLPNIARKRRESLAGGQRPTEWARVTERMWKGWNSPETIRSKQIV